MKVSMRYLVLFLGLYLFMFSDFGIAAQSGNTEPMWKSFGLKQKKIEGATVYYEACFEEKLGVFKKEYQQFIQNVSNNDTKQLEDKKEVIFKEIETILGPDEKLRAAFDKITTAMLEMGEQSQEILNSETDFYLIKRKTAKDYLRQGGKLPYFSYDRATDMVTYSLKYDSNMAGKKEMPLPFSSVEEFDKEIQLFFSRMIETKEFMSTEIAIHEISEVCLILRFGSRGQVPFLRWFQDGLANAMTYEILRKHIGEDQAEAFWKNERSIEDLAINENEVNLQHWMLLEVNFGNDVPVEKESDLTIARYRCAFIEVKRLIDEHGIECIKKIIDTFNLVKKRNMASFYSTIKEVTGEDLPERFKRYQTFDTRKEGMKKYGTQYNKAQKAKNMNDAVYSLLRVLEMYDSPMDPDSIKTRKAISQLLARMGQGDFADEKFCDWIKRTEAISKRTNDQRLEMYCKSMFMQYAFEVGRPQIAFDYAGDVHEKFPDSELAGAILMVKAMYDKEFEKARSIAEKIQKKHPEKKHPLNNIARQVLSQIPKR